MFKSGDVIRSSISFKIYKVKDFNVLSKYYTCESVELNGSLFFLNKEYVESWFSLYATVTTSGITPNYNYTNLPVGISPDGMSFDRGPSLSPSEQNNTTCDHKWTAYYGFTESYQFCAKCGKKEDMNG